MANDIIRPSALPNRSSPSPSEKVVVDNGDSVAGSSIRQIALSGRPTASQAEAEAGVDSLKAMTPLTVAQKIQFEIGRTIASVVTSPGHIFGLQLSNNGGDPANDINIGSGEAASDSSIPVLMKLPETIVKRLDFAWSTGFGGLDTGTKEANKWYHVWLISRQSDGAVNALFSLSATNPVMPSGWTEKRRIGAIGTDGTGTIRPFVQAGSYFGLVTPFSVATGANNGSVQRTLDVPLGVKLRLHLAAYFTSPTNTAFLAVKDADEGVATNSDFIGYSAAAGQNGAGVGFVFCNASGQVYTYSNRTDTTLTNLYLKGWNDQRGAQYADI